MKNSFKLLLFIFLLASFFIKLFFILRFRSTLTLSSDDLNYLKSAAYFIKKGILTYQEFIEPTVFIMPLYPLLCALIIKLSGNIAAGILAIRVVQALFATATVLIVFLLAKHYFDIRTAFISAFLMSIYMPNITSAGYILTETLFTFLLCLLIYLSVSARGKPSLIRLCAIAFIWAAATMCRPTIAFYPVFLVLYWYLSGIYKIKELVKPCIILSSVFIVLMSPWWIRNYVEYSMFIPLSASGGNPMLQGTYPYYRQTPSNATVYKIGRNALATDKIENDIAKKRIIDGFKKDFAGYLGWYTIVKTKFFWYSPFYWRTYGFVSPNFVFAVHYILILGLFYLIVLSFKDIKKYVLILSVILYFNVVHCVYMAFDRYAFPLMPLISVFSSCLITVMYDYIKGRNKNTIL